MCRSASPGRQAESLTATVVVHEFGPVCVNTGLAETKAIAGGCGSSGVMHVKSFSVVVAAVSGLPVSVGV